MLEAGQHVVGFMAADPRRHRIDRHAIGREAGHDQLHVTRGIAPALGRDRVPEEGHFVPGFDEDFRGDRGRGETE